jgi:enoyl-CoA hydratase
VSRIADLIGASAEPFLSIRQGSILLLIINRPAARNALTRQMRRDFPALVAAADADESVAAVILTGADPSFSAGVDLKERAAGVQPPVTPHPGDVLRAVRKPIIAAVNGACVTGALEMALSCSFIVASSEARFADTHARVGLVPRWGQTALLPSAIGFRRARQMMLTGEFIDAGTALAWGLVNEVVAPDQLIDRCLALGDRIARASTSSVSAQMQASRTTAAAELAAGLDAERQALSVWDAAQ